MTTYLMPQATVPPVIQRDQKASTVVNPSYQTRYIPNGASSNTRPSQGQMWPRGVK